MKIKDFTLHLTKKIQKAQFEPLEAGVGITVEIGEKEDWKEESHKLWQELKKQVEEGLDQDTEEWLKKGEEK